MSGRSPEVNQTASETEYNITCSLDIFIYISSRQNSAIVYTFMGVGSILFSLTALVGNTIILLALRRCTSLYPASKSLFYSLAISDFAIGLVAQPLFAAYLLAIAWDNARLFCIVGLPYSLTASFLAIVSFWTLTVIALDRYLALHLRFRYRLVVKLNRVVATLVSGWLLIAFITASRILNVKLRQVLSNLVLLFCLVLSTYFYIKTYFNLRQHKTQIQTQSSFNLARYRKSLNSMFFVFCLFVTTYLPFLCSMVVATVAGFNSLTLLILDITSLIALLNSSLNPVVYCWRVRDLKLEALRVIRTFLSWFPVPSRGRYSFRVTPNNANSSTTRS